MKQPSQMGKRIVSKGEYVQVLGMRASMEVYGMFLMILATCSATAAFGAIFVSLGAIVFLIFGDDKTYAVLFLLLSLLAGGLCKGVAKYSWYSGIKILDRSQDLSAIVPLTRANTVDLPAPDTLVRASEEPRQEQESVLLRAATADVERHEEQLMRAAGEPK